MQTESVLNDIYGNDDSAVMAINMSGEVIWKNAAADLLLGKSEISLREVLAAIKMSGRDNGSLFVGGGGCFRKIRLRSQDMFIAEVYSLDRLSGAFSTPFFAKYLRNSNTQTHQAVTAISACCERLNGLIENASDKDDAAFYLDSIISNCCRLLRSSDMGTQLAKAVSEKNIHAELIYLSDFIKNLTEGCVSAMGNAHCSVCPDMPDCFVRTDRTLLIYFILMLTRKIMPHKNMRLSFEANTDGQTAEIIVCSEEIGNIPDSEKISNNDSAFHEAYDIIAKKLGVEYSLAQNRAVIKLKCTQHNGEIVFESDRITFGDGLFSPYRVMLSDLTEYRSFY